MDVSNKTALLVGALVNVAVWAMQVQGWRIAPFPILIFSIIGIFLIMLKNYRDTKNRKQIPLPKSTSLSKSTRPAPLNRADELRIRSREIDRLTTLIKATENEIAVKQAKGEYFSGLPGLIEGIPELLEKKKRYMSELTNLEGGPSVIAEVQTVAPPSTEIISENNSEAFKRLDIKSLRFHAKRWLTKYPEALIEKIVLYRSSHLKHQGYFGPISAKYFVAFEVPESSDFSRLQTAT